MSQVPELWLQVSAKLSAGDVPPEGHPAKEGSVATGTDDYALSCAPACPWCTYDPGPGASVVGKAPGDR